MGEAVRVRAADENSKAEPRRKPYHKPEFRFEPAFETMALACGKISPSQPQCRFNRKSS